MEKRKNVLLQEQPVLAVERPQGEGGHEPEGQVSEVDRAVVAGLQVEAADCFGGEQSGWSTPLEVESLGILISQLSINDLTFLLYKCLNLNTKYSNEK